MYDLHKNHTEETCLRLYKSISGALRLVMSGTRWSRLRQFGGRGFATGGGVKKFRAHFARVNYIMQGSRSDRKVQVKNSVP